MSCQQTNSLGNVMYGTYEKTLNNIEQNMEQEQPKYFKCGININYLIRLHLYGAKISNKQMQNTKKCLGKV